ncbi:hypothetical protein LINGRAHAP2_LOCUS8530 [Linum grandiflorum]
MAKTVVDVFVQPELCSSTYIWRNTTRRQLVRGTNWYNPKQEHSGTSVGSTN